MPAFLNGSSMINVILPVQIIHFVNGRIINKRSHFSSHGAQFRPFFYPGPGFQSDGEIHLSLPRVPNRPDFQPDLSPTSLMNHRFIFPSAKSPAADHLGMD